MTPERTFDGIWGLKIYAIYATYLFWTPLFGMNTHPQIFFEMKDSLEKSSSVKPAEHYCFENNLEVRGVSPRSSRVFSSLLTVAVCTLEYYARILKILTVYRNFRSCTAKESIRPIHFETRRGACKNSYWLYLLVQSRWVSNKCNLFRCGPDLWTNCASNISFGVSTFCYMSGAAIRLKTVRHRG